MNYSPSSRGWTEYRSPLDERNRRARILRSAHKAEREGARPMFSALDWIGLTALVLALLVVVL